MYKKHKGKVVSKERILSGDMILELTGRYAKRKGRKIPIYRKAQEPLTQSELDKKKERESLFKQEVDLAVAEAESKGIDTGRSIGTGFDLVDMPIPRKPIILSDFKVSVTNKKGNVVLEFNKPINSDDVVRLVGELLRPDFFGGLLYGRTE